MKKLRSMGLWVIGGIFFSGTALILVFCLFLLPQTTSYGVVRSLFKILIRLMGIRLVVTGIENIRPNQPYLIMGNHQSLFDIFVIPAAIPLCFVGVEAARHFSVPVWGYLIRKWGCLPIERTNLSSAIQTLKMARQTLLSGMSIGILPEGHRTLTGKMMPFKKGPVHLANAAGADILPFGINGLFNYHQKGSILLNPGKVCVSIGKPVAYETIKNLSEEKIRKKLFELNS